MESLNTRRAYQQFNEPVSRLASFIGTSNRYDLLTDTTGSRRFICVDVKQKKVFTLSATEIYEKMKKHHPAAMRGVTSDKVSRMLPGLGRRIHTRYGNGYRVVEKK